MGVENDEEFFVKPAEGSGSEVNLPQRGTDGCEPDELVAQSRADVDPTRARLKLLISYFAESDTRFLVYSRANEEALGQNMKDLLSDLEAEYPGLMSRVGVFGLSDYGPSSWLSPLTANPLSYASWRYSAFSGRRNSSVVAS